MSGAFVLRGPRICSPDKVYDRHEMLIEEGKIAAIRPFTKTSLQVINFPDETYLVPGMIDMHVHGAMGKDVMDATFDALETISRALAKEGVTGFLATTMTEPVQRIEQALVNVAAWRERAVNKNCHDKHGPETLNGAQVLGIHLEGPFLSGDYTGAQDGTFLLKPDIERFRRWQALAKGAIRLVTVAPELEGALPFIRYLRENKVIAALGHTGASYEEARLAIDEGAHYATHLFNAMSGAAHREPGVAMAVLDSPDMTAELIADGKHLHPSTVRFVSRIKPASRLLLVSDAMRAKCLGEGVFELGGQAVIVKNHEARLQKNGKLAGSVLRMNEAMKNYCAFAGVPLHDALPLVAQNQARLLGLSDRGELIPGRLADLVVLTENHEVLATLKHGKFIYRREEYGKP